MIIFIEISKNGSSSFFVSVSPNACPTQPFLLGSSMITRELRQTAGNISVYGHDIRTSWDKARKLMGMCPQKAVLFPLMTVRETLAYYTRLKGTAADQTDAEVNS